MYYSLRKLTKCIFLSAKVNGVCSALRPILHPSFVEIRCVVFVLYCWHSNRQKGEHLGGDDDGSAIALKNLKNVFQVETYAVHALQARGLSLCM